MRKSWKFLGNHLKPRWKSHIPAKTIHWETKKPVRTWRIQRKERCLRELGKREKEIYFFVSPKRDSLLFFHNFSFVRFFHDFSHSRPKYFISFILLFFYFFGFDIIRYHFLFHYQFIVFLASVCVAFLSAFVVVLAARFENEWMKEL